MHAHIAIFLQWYTLCINQREEYNSSLVCKVKLSFFVLDFVQKKLSPLTYILSI